MYLIDLLSKYNFVLSVSNLVLLFEFQHIGLYQDVERGTAVSVDFTKRDDLVVVSQLVLAKFRFNLFNI